jgi:two-component system response regulator HydG
MRTSARAGDGVIEALLAYEFPRQHPRAREHGRAGRRALRRRRDRRRRHPPRAEPAQAPADLGGRSLAEIVDAAERQAIEARCASATAAASGGRGQLGISPTTLWRKMTRLQISYPPS